MFEENIFYVYMKFDHDLNEWSEITQISDKTKGGTGEDIDLDVNGHIHFVWRYKTPAVPNNIEDSTMYRFYNGTTWSSPKLVAVETGLFAQKVQVINNEIYIMECEEDGVGANIVQYVKANNAWIGENVIFINGSINVLKKFGNTLNLVYIAKPDDDNLNIYFLRNEIDTTTIADENNMNIQTINIFPNPFSSDLKIKFNLRKTCHVRIVIYSIEGKLIKTIANEEKPLGSITVSWNGTNRYGNRVDSGIYILKIETDSNVVSKSIILQ